MTVAWWELPGPAHFVDSVAQNLRDGKNVVLCMPAHAPTGLSSVIRRAFRDRDWDPLPIDPRDERPPVKQIYDQCVPESGPPSRIRNAGTLVAEPSFAGRLVWITGMPTERWPDWSAFLSGYAHACRAHELYDRPLFCIVLEGALALCPPTPDTCLACHRWDGAVDLFDVVLFATGLVRHASLSGVERRMAATTVAQIAAWDREVAERLANEPYPRLLDPRPVLREIVTERDWASEEQVSGWVNGIAANGYDAAWALGVAGMLEHERLVHSAAVLTLERVHPAREIERRLWSAQVGVLLPYVEECRRRIVERFGRAFRLPHFPDGDRRAPILEAAHLEIGHIYHQVVFQGVPLEDDVVRSIRWLKQVRDRLAHLQPLEVDELNELHNGIIKQ